MSMSDPRAKDPDPVAQRFDLAQDVGGQEHGLTPLSRLVDGMAERLLHERVKPRSRLVQEEEVRPSHERGDQDQFLAVALRIRATFLARSRSNRSMSSSR